MNKRAVHGAAVVIFLVNVFYLNHSTASAQTTNGSITIQTMDPTITPKLQASLSGNFLHNTSPGIYQDPLPGPNFQTKTTGSFTENSVLALGLDYTITPTILNQFKAGFLSTHTINGPTAAGFDIGSQGATNYPFQGITSGNFSITPQGNYYPTKDAPRQNFK